MVPRRWSNAQLLRPERMSATKMLVFEREQPHSEASNPIGFIQRYSDALRAALSPITWLSITDRTDGHAAAGFLDGRALDPNGADLQVLVVSETFAGRAPIERQRLVNGQGTLLGEELTSGRVHSMQLKCWTPMQWAKKGKPLTLGAASCAPSTSPVSVLAQPALEQCSPPLDLPPSATEKLACQLDGADCDGSCQKAW